MLEIIPNVHPIFVHFTVALLSAALMFYVLGLLSLKTGFLASYQAEFQVVARWCLWSGALFSLVTAFFGWQAFNSVKHDEPAHIAMLEHRNWALVTLLVYIPIALWVFFRHRADKVGTGPVIAVLFLAQGLLLSTAWHGGELVYRHGLGVLSLPKAGHHHHHGGDADHDHGDEETGAAHTHEEGDEEHHHHEHADDDYF